MAEQTVNHQKAHNATTEPSLELLPKDCWDKNHKVYEDMLIYENCEERVFFCEDCRKIFICVEQNDQIYLRETLPIKTSNKEIAEKLTWLEH